jgi:hypothetical protein
MFGHYTPARPLQAASPTLKLGRPQSGAGTDFIEATETKEGKANRSAPDLTERGRQALKGRRTISP